MKVCEIFTSIQGESTRAGFPCTFIRLSGCNLRCSYCDTAYAWDEGRECSVDEIVSEVSLRGIRIVEITGGEPLLQPEARTLVGRLLDEGFEVLIETNGSVPIGGIDRRATIIMDVKTPGSGFPDSTDAKNFSLLKPTDEVKFVLTDRADYEWAKNIILGHSLADRCRVLLSPAFGRLSPEELSSWMIRDKLCVRLNLQLHKYIFDPNRRSV